MPITYIKAQWRMQSDKYITSWESRTDFKALKRGGCTNEWIYQYCRQAEQRANNQRHWGAHTKWNREFEEEEEKFGDAAESLFHDIPEYEKLYQQIREDVEGDTGMESPSSVGSMVDVSDDVPTPTSSDPAKASQGKKRGRP
ncbi:hypothetical protein L211DRAFT_845075 [Terfezia boudieri ATCC MYA-4762]|uniref:Uncharacterized protein n=1 Tax=Terfezia boudieri ATCC MYA-4762 TaxID=1051890 RepID=A0A3N4M1J9_9PEZI|nr:hypothetical protein L211DRAFT_845075 [Terfezia boudieri ATCC MYA-4762]